ncbi:MAG: DUF4258 domain-containing protein [Armatimonadetes bacterium]|nr:DUF4258 domain-containing protein [Armatimonadota bacterium]
MPLDNEVSVVYTVPVNMEFLRSCVQSQNYRVTAHARQVMAERGIAATMMEKALEFGEIIEREPEDRPYPSVLVLAWSESGDPLHVKCSRSPHSPNLRIVTVYEPEDAKWESDYKRRKPSRG